MTEKELLEVGFEKVEELDDDLTFYYYSYDLNGVAGNGSLITQADDEVIDGNWKVQAWDIDKNLVFEDIEDVKTYINVIEKNILTKEL